MTYISSERKLSLLEKWSNGSGFVENRERLPATTILQKVQTEMRHSVEEVEM